MGSEPVDSHLRTFWWKDFLPESLSDQRMIEDEDNETVSDLG